MEKFRVKLANSTIPSERVIFTTTPDLIETRNVNYKMIDPIHAPGQMASYQNTSSRSFNISQIRLVSRNEVEANINLAILWTLRGWTMPYFGKSTLDQTQKFLRDLGQDTSVFTTEAQQTEFNNSIRNSGAAGRELRGAPPAVLLLSAYSDDSTANNSTFGKHISRVPVVIQNLSIPYPSDCDYIPAAGSGIPMPTLMTIDLTLTETQAPASFSEFDLGAYKLGKLRGF